MISEAKLARLENLAKYAAGGGSQKWEADNSGRIYSYEVEIGSCPYDLDSAEYIAEASPPVMLELVATIRSLKRKLSAQQKGKASRRQGCDKQG